MLTVATRDSEKRTGHNGEPETLKRRPAAGAAPTNAAWTSLALRRSALAVSRPTDPSEREAERIADAITRAPSGIVQRRCAACAGSATPCPECDEQQRVQRYAADGGRSSAREPHAGGPAHLGIGNALDAPTRQWFEPRMGADLSAVRIHTDAAAGRAADDLDAHAFTVGPHIAFADGRYSPHTTSGRRLIAHELTHVLQGGLDLRRSAVSGRDLPSGEGDKPAERGVYVPASTPRAPTIPSPETCPPPKDMTCPPATTPSGAVTHTLQFDQGSDGLTSLQRKEIDSAAAAWRTAGGSVMVRIDGFASAEGQCEYNWDLSCRRAKAVASEIEHPIDGSAGVPPGSVEIYAHGESDAAGHALAPNRRATISVPVPPPPPPPPAAKPTCAFPVRLGLGRTGCAGGDDYGHFDYPPKSLSTTSAAKLANWAAARPFSRGPFRSLVTDFECKVEMDAVLTALAGSEGHAAYSQFVAGSGGKVTHGPGTVLGAMALKSGSFKATVAAVQKDIETQLSAQASSGALDPCALSVVPPGTSFSFSDGVALKAVIGGTQGEELFANGFTGNVALRTYSIDLHFVICDDFGVDESDLYAPGLFPFWVLQHERSSSLYAPFVNELDLTMTVSGTF